MMHERIENLEKKIKETRNSLKYYKEKLYSRENCLLIGGYSGISIPLDDTMKKALQKYISDTIFEMVKDDMKLRELFVNTAMKYQDSFKEIFRPVVKELIEDLDFNVEFRSYGGEDDD